MVDRSPSCIKDVLTMDQSTAFKDIVLNNGRWIDRSPLKDVLNIVLKDVLKDGSIDRRIKRSIAVKDAVEWL
jgi:ABC-type amino acid transport substrate-binding protein